jgi:hypothetical protein
MKIFFITLICLTSLTKAYAQVLTPGIWKAKSSFKLNGLPLPGNDEEECITGDQAKDVKKTIEKGIKEKGCVLTKWKVKGSKLEASLSCQGKNLKAEGHLQGDVSPKSYNLSGEATGSLKGFPTFADIKLSGVWVKACPK